MRYIKDVKFAIIKILISYDSPEKLFDKGVRIQKKEKKKKRTYCKYHN
jgi:hypothetical protein